MSITERLKEIVEYYNISIRAFEKSIGVSNNSIQVAIKRNSDIKTATVNKILQVYPEINPIWLVTGKGKMLKDDKDVSKNAQNEGQKMADEKYIRDLVWSQTKEAFDSLYKHLGLYTIKLQKEKIERLEEELKREKSLKRNADKADK